MTRAAVLLLLERLLVALRRVTFRASGSVPPTEGREPIMIAALLGVGLALASGPKMPEFTPSDREAEALEASMMSSLLDAYIDRADTIVVAEVVSASYLNNEKVRGTRAIVTVQERIKGAPSSILDVTIPPEGDYFDADPYKVPMSAVPGYTMLLFLDDDGDLIAHNALFLVDGGFVWRAKRSSVFLKPVRDRLWTDSIDPTGDYVILPLAQIRQQVTAAAPTGARLAQRSWRRDR